MRILLLFSFLAINMVSFAQELPTEPANGFAFPLGTKFTIKLHPTDSIHFDYSLIAFEPFGEIIDIFENDQLFPENGQEGTIEFYFCLATRGETEEEKEDNMKVLLVMKNRTPFALSYQSDIQTSEEGEFEHTSNVGTFPGAKGTEMWPYMIHFIGLHDFRKME